MPPLSPSSQDGSRLHVDGVPRTPPGGTYHSCNLTPMMQADIRSIFPTVLKFHKKQADISPSVPEMWQQHTWEGGKEGRKKQGRKMLVLNSHLRKMEFFFFFHLPAYCLSLKCAANFYKIK